MNKVKSNEIEYKVGFETSEDFNAPLILEMVYVFNVCRILFEAPSLGALRVFRAALMRV